MLAEPLAQIAAQAAAPIEQPTERASREEATSTEPPCETAPSEVTSTEPPSETAPSEPSTPAAACNIALTEMHLGALVGRLMYPGGWIAGERHAGAEPLWTGRRRPYDESTLRKQARELARRGATDVAARAVEASVEQAVAASGAKAVAYTDIFDQVYWTKKPAYAAPIGNRGNRLLAATYFGLTFIRPKDGHALAYHVSWNKPASPLQDALEALHAAPRRARWLTRTIRRHIWDRGGSGRPTLRWAAARRIPYLTVTRGSTHWTRYRRRPRVHTRSKLPVFVRRDVAIARGRSKSSKPPEEVIFPAHPDKGRASTKALRYRTGTPLPKAELRKLDRVYKTRWPSNENPIKALSAVGFDRNLDRGLSPTTSRGADGALARVEEREQALVEKVKAFKPTTLQKTMQGIRRFYREKIACERKRKEIAAIPQDKGARMPTGAEGFCKNLMLLMYNMLVLLLARSSLKEVQSMSVLRVHELLLGRSLVTYPEEQGITLRIDPVPDSSERVLQEELVRLFNDRSLSIRGRRLYLRLHDPPGQMPPLRFSG